MDKLAVWTLGYNIAMELGEHIRSKQIFVLELDVETGEMLRNMTLFHVARGNHITLDNRVLGHTCMRRQT